MRPHTLIFRLSAATAVAGLVLAQVIPQSALAQPAPSTAAPAAPDQQTADPPERAGWLAQVSGTVSFHAQDGDQWSPAAMNYPVASGDAFWTEPDASARIVISDSRIALAGGTELDVGTLDPNGLQATLPQGEIYLNVRNLAQNETWSVQTPRGLVTFSGSGRYGIAAGDTQNPTTVTVLEGAAQVTGTGLALQVAQGQTATITGADTPQGTVGAAQTDAFLTAMQQAEQPAPAPAPTATAGPAVAPPPVVAQIPGGASLSSYGSWSQTSEYGNVWYPQVASGWAPYHDGHWAFIAPWGWTWVDDAPWGFAPFHYGRWAEIGGRWGWTPGVVAAEGPPVYAPALVAFVGIGVGIGIGAALASGSVGWVPLGPREVYRPWYHTSDRYLRQVNRRDVTNITVINNRNVTINNFVNRRAVTVVPARAMAESRPVRQVAERVDPRTLASARPVFGTPPIRPTAATAGITPGQAQRMHLAPGPAGAAAAARAAPGPAIRAPLARGVAARPTLRNPAERAGVAPGRGGVPAVGPAERAAPGTRPGVGGEARPGVGGESRPGVGGEPRPGAAGEPGGRPALRTPAERAGGPPPIEHGGPPGREGPSREAEPRGAAPAGVVRPGAPSAGPERPALAAPTAPSRPTVPQVERPGVVSPTPAERPTAPGAGSRPAPGTETRGPAAANPAARPEVHAPAAVQGPRPAVQAPRPEMHVAPRPETHAAPRPQMRAAPRPEVHNAPRPQMHSAPRPAPHPAPAAHHEERKK